MDEYREYQPENGLAWEAPAPTLLLDTEELTPPEYEVRVYDISQSKRLVAAIEIVSPSNKDRPTAREEFVPKCHAMIAQDICVVIIDPVTTRGANLYAELAERIGAKAPSNADASMYAASCRPQHFRDRTRIQTWEHTLEMGDVLPTLPLWISDVKYIPLDLESTYEDACTGLRIA
jgi:hypothetical protein